MGAGLPTPNIRRTKSHETAVHRSCLGRSQPQVGLRDVDYTSVSSAGQSYCKEEPGVQTGAKASSVPRNSAYLGQMSAGVTFRISPTTERNDRCNTSYLLQGKTLLQPGEWCLLRIPDLADQTEECRRQEEEARRNQIAYQPRYAAIHNGMLGH